MLTSDIPKPLWFEVLPVAVSTLLGEGKINCDAMKEVFETEGESVPNDEFGAALFQSGTKIWKN